MATTAISWCDAIMRMGTWKRKCTPSTTGTVIVRIRTPGILTVFMGPPLLSGPTAGICFIAIRTGGTAQVSPSAWGLDPGDIGVAPTHTVVLDGDTIHSTGARIIAHTPTYRPTRGMAVAMVMEAFG